MHELSNSGNMQVKSEPINFRNYQTSYSIFPFISPYLGVSSLSAPIANHRVPSSKTHSNIFMMSQEPKSESCA
jgi:hypothetical protein